MTLLRHGWMKPILYLIVACVAVLVTWISYLYLTYVNETVASGGWHSLTIGDSKEVAYAKVPGIFAELNPSAPKIFIEIIANDQTAMHLAVDVGYTTMVATRMDDIGFNLFYTRDVWKFYIDASYHNSLTLTFCDDQLCEIHRHRKFFELP